MLRVIHTGDTHVGYQQYHSPVRREDFRRAFQAVVDDAVDEGVDAVLHAGDLFHDRRPGLPDLMAVLSALRTLQDADIPFLAVVGNHETTRTGEWLDLFAEMGLATRLGTDPVELGDVAFYGLDWVPKSRREELDYQFTESDATHCALVGHGLFTPFQHGEWDTAEILDASNVPFGAVLLGDNHKPETAEVGGAWVTYCGSTERASASEEEPRGYNLVEFDPGAAETENPKAGIDVRRRSLETRPFRFVSVDLAEGEGVERVREQVRQHDLDEAVCIVELVGEGDPVTPAAVEEAALEEGALVVRVTDRREVEEDTEIQVTFADPDDAVRERVSELGLSPAAHEVDELVRASKTADSNVRDAVNTRVADLIDDDPGAFEPAEAPAESEVSADEESAADVSESESESESGSESESEPGSKSESDAGDDDGGGETGEPSSGSSEPVGESVSETVDEASESPETEGETAPVTNGQGTMEDYL
jgi:exonuclease SbcD